MENMDWALFVAVLSLLFTAMVSIITIRYTRKSLDYTKKSTVIAKESLEAAQKSIDTSTKIYEQQKNDNTAEKQEFNRAKVESIKEILKYELTKNYVNFRSMLNTFNIIASCNDCTVYFERIGFDEILAHSPSTGTNSFKVNFKPICESIDILCDIMLLDKNIALSIISLNHDTVRLLEPINIITNFIRDKDVKDADKILKFRELISDFDFTISRYAENMEKLYKLCEGKNTLSFIYEDAVKKQSMA